MAELIAVPLKKPSDVDVVQPLKNTINVIYSTSQKAEDYTEQVNEFSKLRVSAVWKAYEKYESSLEVIYRRRLKLENKPTEQNMILEEKNKLSSKEETTMCPLCDRKVQDIDSAVLCEGSCTTGYHVGLLCMGMMDDHYNKLSNKAIWYSKWHCPHCSLDDSTTCNSTNSKGNELSQSEIRLNRILEDI